MTLLVNRAGSKRDHLVKAAENFYRLATEVASEYEWGADVRKSVSLNALLQAAMMVDLYAPRLSEAAWDLLDVVEADRKGRGDSRASDREAVYQRELIFHRQLRQYETRMREVLGLSRSARPDSLISYDRLMQPTKLAFVLSDPREATFLEEELFHLGAVVKRTAATVSHGKLDGEAVELSEPTDQVGVALVVDSPWLTPHYVRGLVRRFARRSSSQEAGQAPRELSTVVEIPRRES